MKWAKRGQIFEPRNAQPWMASHAAVPTVMPLDGDTVRIYFSARDDQNRARVGRLDFDLERGRVLRVYDKPVLDIGALGAFDDHGVVGSWIVEHGARSYLYFAGVTLGVTVPFYFYLGLAVSDDGGTSFSRLSPSPLLERDAVDPFLTGQACVRIEDGLWHMWYVSGTRWEQGAAGPKHYYHIKYAESVDGVAWARRGVVCIDFEGDEYAIARPCVLKDADRYRMWYCYRGPSYRIGYAESDDGVRWQRLDARAGIAVSDEGWDSEMLAYPCVYDHRGQRYLFYNGNGYGRTGLGWAVLE